MSAWPTCMPVYHMCVWLPSEAGSDLLELESQPLLATLQMLMIELGFSGRVASPLNIAICLAPRCTFYFIFLNTVKTIKNKMIFKKNGYLERSREL